MSKLTEIKDDVTIMFAGDSGDGIQLAGTQFTDTAALFGNDISTFPNFPAEIRAPQGTLAGVSGFQLHFGSVKINTPGDKLDVLVVMNAAALKANLKNLKKGGTIIANIDGFDRKNLKLAQYDDNQNPLEDNSLNNYKLYTIDVTKQTKASLSESGLGTKDAERSKNMFLLGFIYWMYNRKMDSTIKFIEDKFKHNQQLIDANIKVLKAGYNFGETSEVFSNRYEVKAAPMPKGTYRGITGNQATALGLIAAAEKSGLKLFYGTYPITPASDILHELSKHKNFGVKTFQAEDEIAAICASIGASFGGALAVTGSSGPGIALKTEAIGLALMLELPLVIVNVQRGGPSTGLPTKTEQADLLQAVYGRNGEAPVPVIAACSPSNCFDMVFEACRIAVEYMTPVMLLTDGYIANGAEPWKFPSSTELPEIKVEFAQSSNTIENFMPYARNEKLARPWAIPGTKGLEHRIGGLEKEDITGNISYDPNNHEKMVKLRAAKVEGISHRIPEQTYENGQKNADVLLVGWGGTYGVIKSAVAELIAEGFSVAHIHVKYLNPFPSNLGSILKQHKNILVPELNNGQLVKIIRDKYLVPAQGINKIQGLPFHASDIKEAVYTLLNQKSILAGNPA
ncbi:MAG: 2-oxoacid:acceptor oxidoreductase subunit alpha [Bacteroidia bacterium]|nr:2-oxoacid:acceptor oxidoreductase subunit alpha [Bacteroidia bacterium]MCZ2248658.1 2-oxoacid:acceptor oxidoreductase subunit alpha [Bacteroidia bacterium]